MSQSHGELCSSALLSIVVSYVEIQSASFLGPTGPHPRFTQSAWHPWLSERAPWAMLTHGQGLETALLVDGFLVNL